MPVRRIRLTCRPSRDRRSRCRRQSPTRTVGSGCGRPRSSEPSCDACVDRDTRQTRQRPDSRGTLHRTQETFIHLTAPALATVSLESDPDCPNYKNLLMLTHRRTLYGFVDKSRSNQARRQS